MPTDHMYSLMIQDEMKARSLLTENGRTFEVREAQPFYVLYHGPVGELGPTMIVSKQTDRPSAEADIWRQVVVFLDTLESRTKRDSCHYWH